ncbi:hypothetical protein LOS88_11570 [Aeromonas veronii]|uniref:hypothetical protein n=1 Tax=Aeromonas veronii TaxID=654 RepID=UPI001FD20B8E|nr:hypothetical protein [Aeromonas veronii]MCJ7978352.1 hypothetical protein [Aeromonas veronii]UOR21204.1 hypothetical protein LOS88_11520 [Aeromonas veronii]UOR21214.1 hypothetical protein LOS88_11570 [Aeromonas veronii]
MRYLLPLFFSPFAAFAGCAPGVNYGSAHIVSPNPICYLYSGSTQGGCYAYCGGSENGSVCVELPNAVPPTRGPYFSSGQECTPTDNNGPGKDPNPSVGEDGTAIGGDGVVNMGELWVGPTSHSDLGKGFNVVSNNIRVSSEKVVGAIQKQTDNISQNLQDLGGRYLNSLTTYLPNISSNTAAISNSISSMPFDLRVSKEYLASIDKNIAKLAPGSGSGGGSGDTELIRDILQNTYSINSGIMSIHNSTSPLSGQLSGVLSMQGENINAIRGVGGNIIDKLSQIANNRPWGSSEFAQIASKLDGIKKSIDNGAGAEKPCKGPLCSFNKPSGASGSALSKVFSTESIDDVKKQIDNKDNEISDAMNDIKSVFAPEELTITGTYNNDYHDINGVRVDLSGKSNLELFFNSGPKMAIWFLAVLLAFSILMGGRKNA